LIDASIKARADAIFAVLADPAIDETTGKRPTARSLSSPVFQDMHQGHDQWLLPHVKPGDGPSDDHALKLARSFKYREARGGAASFRS
jgi:hypothetical protein